MALHRLLESVIILIILRTARKGTTEHTIKSSTYFIDKQAH